MGTVLVLPSTVLAGCSVPTGSFLALGKHEDGSVYVAVAHCQGYLDTFLIYDSELGDRSPDFITVTLSQPLRDDADIDLMTSTTTATVTPEGYEFEDGVRYVVGGYTESNEWAAPGLEFTTDDLARISPGTVITESADDLTAMIVVSRQRFRATACDQ